MNFAIEGLGFRFVSGPEWFMIHEDTASSVKPENSPHPKEDLVLRWILSCLLLLFRDRYVQTGTLLGLIAGLFGAEFLFTTPEVAAPALALVGWGLGAYFGYHQPTLTSRKRKPKLKVYQGGR